MKAGESITVASVVASTRPVFGGPSYTVPTLVKYLEKAGLDSRLLTIRHFDENEKDALVFSAAGKAFRGFVSERAKFAWSPFIGMQFEKYFVNHRVSLVHNHGIWLPINHSALRAASAHGIPIVVSPRGMLKRQALRMKRFKKRLAWVLYQRNDLALATAFHATSKDEAREIRELGFIQPIGLIPNGVDLPDLEFCQPKEHGQSRVALFLSRIHPSKGLGDLVKAWDIVRPRGWRCIIAGPSEAGERRRIEREVEKLGLGDRFVFTGIVSGYEKEKLYRGASLFVFPSYTENFGVVVAEALSYGVPVITTKGTPWREIRETRCGWWIDADLRAWARALKEATETSQDLLNEMGTRGRHLIEEKYSWHEATKQISKFYSWIIRGDSVRPDCLF